MLSKVSLPCIKAGTVQRDGLAEGMLIRKVFIKERDAEVFRKIRPSPIIREPLIATAPPRTTVGCLETNCQRRTQLCQQPFIPYMHLLASAL
jgi:hypothetical protein